MAKASNKDFFGFLGRSLVNNLRSSGDLGKAVAGSIIDLGSAAAMSAEGEKGFTPEGDETVSAEEKEKAILTEGESIPEKSEV